MAKLTLSDLANLSNDTTAVATINANNALIEAAMDSALFRSGTAPNFMEANLDMNSNRILNLGSPGTDNEPLRLGDLDGYLGTLETGVFTLATQGQAEVGTNNTSVMTALRTAQAINAQFMRFEKFLPDDFDITTDDAGPYLETASAYSAANNVRIIVGRQRYLIKTAVELNDNGASFHWDNAYFTISDVSAMNQILYDESHGILQGRIGILVSGDNQLHTGHLSLIGTGTLSATPAGGGTTLTGIVFYECDDTHFLATLYAEHLSSGRMVQFCNDCHFGDLIGQDIIGTSTFSAGADSQGDLEVINGAVRCVFGKTIGRNVHKPARYLSLGADSTNTYVQTEYCLFGDTYSEGQSGSTESSVLSIRNASNCVFGRVFGRGVNIGLNFQCYNGDTVEVSNNHVGWVHVSNATTANSAAARVVGDTTRNVGTNWIEGVSCDTAAQAGFSLFYQDATYVGKMYLNDCLIPFYLDDGVFGIDEIVITNQGDESNYYSSTASGKIGAIRCLTGLGGAGNPLIKNSDTSTASGIYIGEIEYAQNGVGVDPTFLLSDDYTTPRDVRVWNCKGTGSSGQLRFINNSAANVDMYVCEGWYYANYTLAEATGIANGSLKTETIAFPDVAATDLIQWHYTSAPPGFVANLHRTGTDTLTFNAINCTGGSATYPARTIRVYVKYVD